jgi:hypothetical protein
MVIARSSAAYSRILTIARRRFGVLIDRNGDGLDVVIALAFMHPDAPDLRQRFEKWRGVGIIAEILHHLRPPKTRRSRGSDCFSRSRSAQRSSILVCMRSNNASAAAVDIPAF